MIVKNLTKLPLQTFFVTREVSQCPLIADIIKLEKKFERLKIITNNDFCFSVTYGKRILINAKDFDIEHMNQEDFIEIVDFDPFKNFIIIMGKKNPNIDTPVHWLIHHAREDVNAVIQINGGKIVNKLLKSLPITKKEYPTGTLEQAKEVLKTLKDGKKILIKNRGFLFVGVSLKEVEEMVINTYEVTK